MSLAERVQEVLSDAGEPAVAVLIALENLFPPLPSEVILPFAGFQAARGHMTFVGAWVAATIGAVVGAWILFWLGRAFGYERLHDLAGKRWFFVLSQSDLERGDRFFDLHGGKIVLLGRCIPLVRSVVSVPAGLSGMPLLRFTVFTALGSAVWNFLFIFAGWQLEERWDVVERWMGPASIAVVVVLVIGAAALAYRKLRRTETV